MNQKKLVSRLILLLLFSILFFQAALFYRVKASPNFFASTTLNSAQLTPVNRIEINSNSDWIGLSGYPWFQGNGTFLDPYIISNISIYGDINDRNNIAINNSSVYFIIQNSRFVLDANFIGLGVAGIYLQNVENGTIYNNEFNNADEASCIELRECYNISIVKNNAIEGFYGFNIHDSEKINVSNNVITDCFSGISLNNCNYSSFYNNEIRLTENYYSVAHKRGYEPNNYGISLYYSNFNNISENHFYCIPYPIFDYYNSVGNIIENNIIHSCDRYDPMIVLNAEFLISFLSMVGIIILLSVIARKYPQRKRMVGIVSIILSFGIMGLLTHGAYNVGLVVAWYQRMYYIMGLVALIGVNLTLLILSSRLIIKKTSRSNSK